MNVANTTANTTPAAVTTTPAALLKNRVKTVTTTIDGVSKSAVRAVNLRRADFAMDNARLVWAGYSRRLLALSVWVKAAAAVADDDENGYFSARKPAYIALKGIADYLCNVSSVGKIALKKSDVDYLVRFGYNRRVNKDFNPAAPISETNAPITVTVKSKSGLQALVEDIMYFRLNGLDVPAVALTTNTADALKKAREADAAAAAKKAAAAKAADAQKAVEAAARQREEMEKAAKLNGPAPADTAAPAEKAAAKTGKGKNKKAA